jgi:hypothetical protein
MRLTTTIMSVTAAALLGACGGEAATSTESDFEDFEGEVGEVSEPLVAGDWAFGYDGAPQFSTGGATRVCQVKIFQNNLWTPGKEKDGRCYWHWGVNEYYYDAPYSFQLLKRRTVGYQWVPPTGLGYDRYSAPAKAVVAKGPNEQQTSTVVCEAQSANGVWHAGKWVQGPGVCYYTLSGRGYNTTNFHYLVAP